MNMEELKTKNERLPIPVEEIQQVMIFATMCADGQPGRFWTAEFTHQMKCVQTWLNQLWKERERDDGKAAAT
jgi:hypothetical protein